MKKLSQLFVTLVLASFTCVAFAFGGSDNANVYSAGQAMTLGNVLAGTVVNVRTVKISAGSASQLAGSGAGAAVGGIIGNQAGHGAGRDVASVLGALAGGFLGHAAANHVASNEGTEIIVALANHRLVSVTQAGRANFYPGEAVYLVQSGESTRVVPRETAASASNCTPSPTAN